VSTGPADRGRLDASAAVGDVTSGIQTSLHRLGVGSMSRSISLTTGLSGSSEGGFGGSSGHGVTSY
jgi:hypothetical protein